MGRPNRFVKFETDYWYFSAERKVKLHYSLELVYAF